MPTPDHLDTLEKRIMVFGLKSPFPLHYSKALVVGDSVLHGKGLFTKEALPANAVLTFYPAHAVTDRSKRRGEKCEVRIWASEEVTKRMTAWIPQHGQAYGHRMNDALMIIGDPLRLDNPLLLAHMANDGAGNTFTLPLEELLQPSNFKMALLQYYVNVMVKCNCRLSVNAQGDSVFMETRRAIQPGEELLVEYGPQYWYEATYGEEAPDIFAHSRATMSEDHFFSSLLSSLTDLL
jgi:hypothetical protein